MSQKTLCTLGVWPLVDGVSWAGAPVLGSVGAGDEQPLIQRGSASHGQKSQQLVSETKHKIPNTKHKTQNRKIKLQNTVMPGNTSYGQISQEFVSDQVFDQEC